jgi:hypothetical protein
MLEPGSVTDLPLMRAQGPLVVFLATMLQTAGVKSLEEFSAQLGLYAVTVAETEPGEGEILAYWAAMVREIAPFSASLTDGL